MVARQVSTRPRAVPLLAIAASVLWLVLQTPGPWGMVLAVTVTAVLGTRTLGWVERRTVALALGVLVASIDYFTWRFSVVNLSALWISVPLVIAELFGAVHVLGHQYTIWPRQEAPLELTRNPRSLPLFVLVPTVDEGVGILEPTLSGVVAAAARYRAANPEARITIVVCNDGIVAGASTTGAVTDLCKRLGVECVTRTTKGGAKAGNLEHARDVFGIHGDALFAIFDADQIPEPEFFLKTIPPFGDPTVGWVQTGQYYRNLEEPVARWANDQQALFYRLVCPGKSTQNSAFICGTNVVIRAAALDEIGGFPRDSVTEDFAASVRMHGRWRSVYLEGVLARGLGPVDLGSYFGQQNRWARGTLSVLSDWRLLLGRQAALVGQWIEYALSSTYYLSGVRDLTYLVAPTVFLLVGTPAFERGNARRLPSSFRPVLRRVADRILVFGGREDHLARRRDRIRVVSDARLGAVLGCVRPPSRVCHHVQAAQGVVDSSRAPPPRRDGGRGRRHLGRRLALRGEPRPDQRALAALHAGDACGVPDAGCPRRRLVNRMGEPDGGPAFPPGPPAPGHAP